LFFTLLINEFFQTLNILFLQTLNSLSLVPLGVLLNTVPMASTAQTLLQAYLWTSTLRTC